MTLRAQSHGQQQNSLMYPWRSPAHAYLGHQIHSWPHLEKQALPTYVHNTQMQMTSSRKHTQTHTQYLFNSTQTTQRLWITKNPSADFFPHAHQACHVFALGLTWSKNELAWTTVPVNVFSSTHTCKTHTRFSLSHTYKPSLSQMVVHKKYWQSNQS